MSALVFFLLYPNNPHPRLSFSRPMVIFSVCGIFFARLSFENPASMIHTNSFRENMSLP